jgi:hypothetical protein
MIPEDLHLRAPSFVHPANNESASLTYGEKERLRRPADKRHGCSSWLVAYARREPLPADIMNHQISGMFIDICFANQ